MSGPSPDKLVILSLQYYSYPDEVGGAWKWTYEVGRRLAARGHRVVLITCKPSDDLADRELIEGIRFERLGARSSKSVLRLFRGIKKRVNSILDESPVDLVHINNPLIGFLALLNSRLWLVPKVYQFYSSWYDEEKINRENPSGEKPPTGTGFRLKLALVLGAIRLVEWICYCSSRGILFLSEYSKNCFQAYYPFKKARLRVIPGGVNVNQFHPPASESVRADLLRDLGLPPDRPILLTVRRLAARMGLVNLVEAVAQIAQRSPELPFRLVIVGRGALAEQLESLIEKNRLGDRVVLTGFVPAEKLPFYYRAADVFVLPTEAIEGFGLATVEAMASGLPVLGTPVGGTVEILKSIDDKMLFRNTSPDALAERIEEFLKSPETFTALGVRCREAAARYDWERVVDRVEEEFKLLCEPGGSN